MASNFSIEIRFQWITYKVMAPTDGSTCFSTTAEQNDRRQFVQQNKYYTTNWVSQQLEAMSHHFVGLVFWHRRTIQPSFPPTTMEKKRNYFNLKKRRFVFFEATTKMLVSPVRIAFTHDHSFAYRYECVLARGRSTTEEFMVGTYTATTGIHCPEYSQIILM